LIGAPATGIWRTFAVAGRELFARVVRRGIDLRDWNLPDAHRTS
jgi:hypothetical protein